jgi:hypothetical protein
MEMPKATPMQARQLLCLGLVAWALAVSPKAMAQVFVEDPDWKEVDVPAPPVFNKDRLIPVNMPPYVTLRFGVDPATVTITDDGVIRYVMVAQGPGAGGTLSAMYEGIRCAAGEFKTYARFGASGQWAMVSNSPWRSLTDNNTSKHALALARQGACDGRAAVARSVRDIVSALKNPPKSPSQ